MVGVRQGQGGVEATAWCGWGCPLWCSCSTLPVVGAGIFRRLLQLLGVVSHTTAGGRGSCPPLERLAEARVKKI